MGLETLLALLTTISMLCAVTMCAFAYRLNEKWAERDAEWAEIYDKQNKMLETINEACWILLKSVRRGQKL